MTGRYLAAHPVKAGRRAFDRFHHAGRHYTASGPQDKEHIAWTFSRLLKVLQLWSCPKRT